MTDRAANTPQWVRANLPDITVARIGRRLHILSAATEAPLCGDYPPLWEGEAEALSTASGPLCRRCSAIQGPEYADV